MMHYKDFFQRNYGIFSADEQERIRNARILIIGCGGIGGTVAVMLARAGVSGFILIDFDVYSASNMNRQIGCFTDTIGQAKAHVIRDTILRINPDAHVETYDRLLTHTEIADLMQDADFIFPAADDFAFSIFVFREAQAQGKSSLLVVPAGTWANVSMIHPDSPPPEDIEGVPKLSTYEELRDTLEIRRYKF
jgi:tRNA A37 threonylcarbamoyladenosine dehydratase